LTTGPVGEGSAGADDADRAWMLEDVVAAATITAMAARTSAPLRVEYIEIPLGLALSESSHLP
jgi:hypothetical protein